MSVYEKTFAGDTYFALAGDDWFRIPASTVSSLAGFRNSRKEEIMEELIMIMSERICPGRYDRIIRKIGKTYIPSNAHNVNLGAYCTMNLKDGVRKIKNEFKHFSAIAVDYTNRKMHEFGSTAENVSYDGLQKCLKGYTLVQRADNVSRQIVKRAYFKSLGIHVNIVFSGKVDGIVQENTSKRHIVIEIKNRVNGLMYLPSKHDVIQLNMYMDILDLQRGLIVERFVNDDGEYFNFFPVIRKSNFIDNLLSDAGFVKTLETIYECVVDDYRFENWLNSARFNTCIPRPHPSDTGRA